MMDANERKKQIETEALNRWPATFLGPVDRRDIFRQGAEWADSHPPSPESELVEFLEYMAKAYREADPFMPLGQFVRQHENELARLSRKDDPFEIPEVSPSHVCAGSFESPKTESDDDGWTRQDYILPEVGRVVGIEPPQPKPESDEVRVPKELFDRLVIHFEESGGYIVEDGFEEPEHCRFFRELQALRGGSK